MSPRSAPRRPSGRRLAAASFLLALAASGCSGGGHHDVPPTSSGGGGLNLSLPAGGGSAAQSFTSAGAVPYKCPIHPTIMTGDTVIVTDAAAPESVLVSVVGLSTPGFSPSTVTIHTGGTVRWVNATGMLHGVVDQ